MSRETCDWLHHDPVLVGPGEFREVLVSRVLTPITRDRCVSGGPLMNMLKEPSTSGRLR